VAPRVAPLAVWAGHVPPAADRAAATGERDPGVLAAVRHHTLGSVEWDDVGRMLYLADFLEPGRDFAAAERADLAQRVPTERDAVLREVARRPASGGAHWARDRARRQGVTAAGSRAPRAAAPASP